MITSTAIILDRDSWLGYLAGHRGAKTMFRYLLSKDLLLVVEN